MKTNAFTRHAGAKTSAPPRVAKARARASESHSVADCAPETGLASAARAPIIRDSFGEEAAELLEYFSRADVLVPAADGSAQTPFIGTATLLSSRELLAATVTAGPPKAADYAKLVRAALRAAARLPSHTHPASTRPLTVVVDNGVEFHTSAFVSTCIELGLDVLRRPFPSSGFRHPVEEDSQALELQVIAMSKTSLGNRSEAPDTMPRDNLKRGACLGVTSPGSGGTEQG
ncbi:hypothetical protein [Falsiroseomonas sp. HW251]|uniref:hypothetical protein n=1 Tax=Falsiroseomonas sp. HW251 TaxID=3390998 RepID=UPI003D317C8A